MKSEVCGSWMSCAAFRRLAPSLPRSSGGDGEQHVAVGIFNIPIFTRLTRDFPFDLAEDF
jgi:hypothetical protein